VLDTEVIDGIGKKAREYYEKAVCHQAEQAQPVLLRPTSASAVAKTGRKSAETSESDCHLSDGLEDAGKFQLAPPNGSGFSCNRQR
jgi:hypothetical protein